MKRIVTAMLVAVGIMHVCCGITVKLDANGGKVSPATVSVWEGGSYDALPTPTNANGAFDGWWTAKDGGVEVQNGDLFDLSIFANPKTPALYAQYHLPHKIAVAGGFLDDGGTARSGLYRGDKVSAHIDRSKLCDRNENEVNAFAHWTFTPAVADLGDGFDPLSPEIAVSMPNADVKLTANFVNGFAGFLHCQCYTEGTDAQGNEPIGDFYWSVDNGKTLFPFGESGYPVKSGKVTVKFYDKTGNWRAADQTFTFEKRGTYKDGGVTRYSDPETKFSFAKFVPVDNSTKVKMDANGGMGSGDVFFANGWEYGWLGIPYRKGYVFAGWWTAKDGGEHITQDKMFDPADFAGQKTPTIYAHWLQLRKLTMKDDSAYAYWDLDGADFDSELLDEITQSLYVDSGFEGYGELEGKGTLEVLPGARVSVSVDGYSYDNKDNELVFQKWTVSPSKENMGPDFRVTQYDTSFTMPNEDVTLQAAYIDESDCGWLRATASASSVELYWDEEQQRYVSIDPPYEAFEWSPDGGKTWYKAGMASAVNVGYYDDDEGEAAMLKAGAYTVTWRSTNPCWATTAKTKVTVWTGDYGDVYATFTYIPQVVVDVMTFENGKLSGSSAGGTVTMNPKDGLVPVGKTITLAAKAAKNYAFQGWAYSKNWEYGDRFEETGATWKFDNHIYQWSSPAGVIIDPGMIFDEGAWLNQFIDPVDEKVHVVAVFRALSDYYADDIRFDGFEGWASSAAATTDGSGNVSVSIKAVVGCALDDDYTLVCGPLASPLAYKIDGKLPDGLKFDAKTGVLSGAPKKAGNTTVKITATDPAKNAKRLTVNFIVSQLPTWLVGEFRGFADQRLYAPSDFASLGQCGMLELSVKSDGKVSGKIITCFGTGSVSGTLSWAQGDENDPVGTYWFEGGKNGWYFNPVYFHPDGTISGNINSYDNSSGRRIIAPITGMRQDTALLNDCPFLNKYYTFAFCATNSVSVYDDGYGYEEINESEVRSGYGYLTIKTDKKGGAKVVGQLPDGEKVSMSALVLPFVDDESEALKARLYVFASPSSYKKQDWFAMSLVIGEDGTVTSEDGAAWTPADVDPAKLQNYYGYDKFTAHVFGEGSLYSEAKSLENYYWVVSCDYSENVIQQYQYDKYYYDSEQALDFDGYFFNVMVKGDSKGTISLDEKSPAPWVEDGEWNCWKDKKGNEISDPSQLSISFTKATGIFSGKASVYFDYPKPTSASLPYTGVMIYDGDGGYVGFGSAVYSYKYSYHDYYGRAKTDTKRVTLPVSLERD